MQNTMSLVAALPSLELAPQIDQPETASLDQLYPAADLLRTITTGAATATAITALFDTAFGSVLETTQPT